MPISEKEYDLIYKYLNKSLSEDEQATFDNLRKKSEEFDKEVASQLGIAAGVFAYQKSAFKNEIKALFNELDTNPASKDNTTSSFLKPWHYGLLVAASIALVLLFITPDWFEGNMTGKELYLNYYEVLPATASTRSDGDNEVGLQLYSDGNYKEAIPYLESLDEESEFEMAAIYLSLAHLELDQDLQATQLLQNTKEKTNDPFVEQHASWYLTLLSLKNEELEKAKEELIRISNQNGIYGGQAEIILEKMD